jgi:AraC-like DNA-binding protein
VIATAPPPIPASIKAASWAARDHLLMWVHTGSAYVRLPGDDLHRVDAGTGIWIPPGSDHSMWTDPGSVALPISVPAHAVRSAVSGATRFTVGKHWNEWLIAQYARAASTGVLTAPGELIEVLAGDSPAHTLRSDANGPGGHPPMPRSGESRSVARRLMENPALSYTVEEWAALVTCSPSTLRREFWRQTGMTFSQWRNGCRLATASELLAAGYEVAHVAARTGFLSRSGFTRAFRRQYQLTPRDFAVLQRGSAARATAAISAEAGRAVVSRPISDRAGDQRAPREPKVPQANSMTWIFRGGEGSRAQKSSAARSGDVLWQPAGAPLEPGLPDGSIAVPLSTLCTECVQIPGPLRTHFSPAWEAYLLYCSVSTHTLLMPESHARLGSRLARPHHQHVLDAFEQQLEVDRYLAVPFPTDPRARRVAMSLLRREPAGPESATAQVSPDIDAAFRRETGMTYRKWREASRMKIARELLADGVKVGSVARRVGYSQLSNFSRTFSSFHGISPRKYQEREFDLSATEAP